MDFVSMLPIILIALGIILLFIEVIIPGFGIAGISGIICLVIGIIVTASTVEQALLLIAVTLVILIIGITIIVKLLSARKIKTKIILYDSLEKNDDEFEDLQYFLGKMGVAVTPLRPAGHVDFDGVRLDVITNGTFIKKGKEVQVIRIEGNKIIVEEIQDEVI